MLQRIFKPKWQHKKPAVRTEAIKNLQDETLLLKILETETDPAAQAAAIDNLHSADALLPLSKTPATQTLADTRIVELLSSDKAPTSAEPFAAFITALDSQELLLQLATQSPSSGVRESAVNKIDDESQLADICANDAHSSIRVSTAKRIHTPELIRKTLKTLGKRDKRATQQLKETLKQQADVQAFEESLATFQLDIEKLGKKTHWQRDKTRLAQLSNEWIPLSAKANEAQQRTLNQALYQADNRIQLRQQMAENTVPIINTKQQLCTKVDDLDTSLQDRQRFSKHDTEQSNTQLETLIAEWQALPAVDEKIEAKLANQFHAQISNIRRQLEILTANASQSHQLESLISKAERTLGYSQIKSSHASKLFQEWNTQTLPSNPQLAEDYRNQFEALQQKIEKRLESQQQTQQQNLEKIEALITHIESNLTDDNLLDSEQRLQDAQTLLKNTDDLTPPQRRDINNRLQAIHPRIKELSGWRHWGTDRARDELIEEAESLAQSQDTDIDIDARAEAVKSLRKRWKSLGQIDPLSKQRLWNQFDQACNNAYAPCKAHYEDIGQQRNEHLVGREEICESLETLLADTQWDQPDWRHLDNALQQYRNRWNKSGAVSRKDWNAIRTRYQTALDQFDSKMDKERQLEIARREQALAQLSQLSEDNDITAATQLAKEIQANWNPTIKARRGLEQKLWKQLRTLSDDVFERQRQNHNALDSELAAVVEQASVLCDQFENQISADLVQQNTLDTFSDDWEQLPRIPQKQHAALQKRFQQLTEDARKQLNKRAMSRAIQYIESVFFEHSKLAALEVSPGQDDAISSFEAELASSAHTQRLQQVFNSRLNRIKHTSQTPLENTLNDEQKRCLIDMEILLDIPSPVDLQEERMARKVERLSAVISAGNRKKPEALVIEHFERFCQFPVPVMGFEPERLSAIYEALKAKFA